MNLFNRWLLIGSFRSLFIVLLCSLVAASCDEPAPRKKAVKRQSTAPVNTLPPPDIFVAAPHTIQGCLGLYTYDTLNIAFEGLDVDKGKKIMATKIAEFAYLRVRGKDVVVKYDRKESKAIDKDTNKEVFRGNGYVVVLVTQVTQVKGEAMLSTGTLEIIQGDKRIKIKVRGVSGC